MKKALLKSSLREIRSTLSRFLSIFGIVAIGVGFFAGVKTAAPDMRNTVDDYLDGSKLMDMRLVSTYGFDDNDIAALREIGGAEVYPSYFTDLVAHYADRSPAAARLIAVSDAVKEEKLNILALVDGRMPEKPGECVVNSTKMMGGPTIGDSVTFTDNSGAVPEDIISVNEYTIVGKVRSAMYIDKTTRGSTSVGNGSIESVYYIPEENFCVEYNTEVYLRFPELDGYNCYESDYKDAMDELKDRAEDIGERRAEERFADIKREADEKLADAEKELADAEAEYNDKIADGEKEISDGEKEIADNEQKIVDAEDEIAENEQKLIDAEAEIAENEQKLIDAQAEITDGEKKLADGEKEIADNEKKLSDGESEIADNRKKLDDARKKYDDGLKEYNDGLKKYNDGLAEYEKNLAELNSRKEQLEAAWEEYNAGAEALEAGKTQLSEQKAAVEAGLAQAAAAMGVPEITDEMLVQLAQADPQMAQLAAGKQAIADAEAEISQNEAVLAASRAQLEEGQSQIDEGSRQLEEGKKTLDDSRKQLDEAAATLENAKKEIDNGDAELAKAENELADGRKKLEDGKKELADNRAKIEDAKRELADGIKEIEDAKQEVADGWVELNDGKTEVEDGKKELADAKVKLEDGRKELEDGKKEGAEKIADAKAELDDARSKIDDLSKPKWYAFTRDGNPGYSEYGENADRINNIASVFPVFFIVVAMLVCLTTMSRMVEEQRVGIGTLKALGYGNASIIFKYMLYAVSATLLGCVVGFTVGMYLFPYVIITAYGMMYDIPGISLGIDPVTAASATLVFTAATALTVYFTSRSALAEQAAQLMRPKTPKNGKRILLEHITPIWKHFNFSGKVTARNLFRYKRKMLMTVIGISGCTALLLTGLALYDAINDIIAKQFNDIQDYQGILAYDREEHPEAADEAADIIAANGGESIRVYQKLVKVNAAGKSVNAYIAVPSEPEKFTEFFDLRSRTTGERFSLTDDTIYIDEKTTLLLNGISAGDSVEIELSETEKYTVTVTAPFENYPNHYVYMTEGGYERIFGEKPEYNVLYFRHGLGTGDEQDKLGEELLAVEGALNVTFNSNTMATFTQMLDTLSMVIVVIIASAGLLAFVVMYNLTNINITERIREIATLKVLGFYDGEVDSYIFRENILLALLGTGAGLVLGIFLARFVITTAEVDLVMFGRNIYPLSFVLAAAATMLFSVLVTLAMHKRLKDVNMIEALKSVE
ncbi:MAG: FtsX-like permease family protein [Ruminiclostridium sp.]|nr:FtsX-like permease family protein [Ruminiclostridium sp.]